MNLFSYKADVFGLDISDLSLKIANVKKVHDGFKLVSFGSGAIKRGVVRNGEIRNENALSLFLLAQAPLNLVLLKMDRCVMKPLL